MKESCLFQKHRHLRSEGSVLIDSKRVEESGSEELLSSDAEDWSCCVSVDVGLAVVSEVEVLEMSNNNNSNTVWEIIYYILYNSIVT